MMVNVMREGERLKEAIEAGEKQTEEVRRERDTLRQEGRAREDDRRSLDRALTNERHRRESKEAELQRREEEVGRLREQIRLRDMEARAKLLKLEEEVRERTASEAKLQQLHNAALKQVLDFNEGLNHERVERASLDLELREKQRVLVSMEEEIHHLKVELRRKEQRAESIEQLKCEIKALQGRLHEFDRLAKESQEMKSRLRASETKLREAEERTREAETKLRDEEKRAKVVKARMDQLRSTGKTHDRMLAELKQREESVTEAQELINRRAIELELLKETLDKQAAKTETKAKDEIKPEEKATLLRKRTTITVTSTKQKGTSEEQEKKSMAASALSAVVQRLPGGGMAVQGMHAVGWVMQMIAYIFVFLYVLATKGRSARSWSRS
jgi:myosin heavy subunit